MLTTWLADTTTTIINYIITKSDLNKLIDVVSTVVPHSATNLRLRIIVRSTKINASCRSSISQPPLSQIGLVLPTRDWEGWNPLRNSVTPQKRDSP